RSRVRAMVNTREKAGPLLRLRVFAFFHFGAQQIHYEGWNEASGEEIGSQQSEYHGFGERYEEIAGPTRQEKHWYEHDADAEGGNKCRNRNLFCSIQNAVVEVLALAELPLDILGFSERTQNQ